MVGCPAADSGERGPGLSPSPIIAGAEGSTYFSLGPPSPDQRPLLPILIKHQIRPPFVFWLHFQGHRPFSSSGPFSSEVWESDLVFKGSPLSFPGIHRVSLKTSQPRASGSLLFLQYGLWSYSTPVNLRRLGDPPLR